MSFFVLLQSTQYAGVPDSNDERIHHVKYLVHLLYPFLKQFDHEQELEKDMEAKIQGMTGTLTINNSPLCMYCNY